jgi:hypothetical protein
MFNKNSSFIEFKKIGEKNRCPNCDKKLNKIPKRKTKCEFCKKDVYVRTRLLDRKKVLVNKKQVEQIEKEYSKHAFINRWIQRLEEFGITKSNITKTRKELSKNFKKEAPMGDVFWGVFNGLILKFAHDLHTQKMIHYSMALFLNDEGKDPYHSLWASAHDGLLYLKERGEHLGYKKVKILSTKGCEYCEKMGGKIYTIEKALKEMPIPAKRCTHKLNGKRGFCRCIWVSVTD